MQLMHADSYPHPRPRRGVAVVRRAVAFAWLGFGIVSCNDPNTSAPRLDPGSDSPDVLDAAPSTDFTAARDAADATFGSFTLEVTRDAQGPSSDDTNRADANTQTLGDANLSHAEDATTDAADSSGTCERDACNADGSCLDRQLWTECDCEPTHLPRCGLPLFRALGRARTSSEWGLNLMSGDGRMAAGTHAFDAETFTSVGVTWTAADGLRILEQHPGGTTIPTAINEDGSLILGYVDLPRGEALDVWWSNGVLQVGLPEAGTIPQANQTVVVTGETVPERTFDVFDATPDGHVAVGKARRSDSQNDARDKEAAIWIRGIGVRFLRDILEEAGLDVSLWQLWHVNAVSDDGLTLLGLGVGPDVGYRWYLQLPASAIE